MYQIFKRSARNFEEFSQAEKINMEEAETIQEAREICANFNDNRTEAEIEAGTKLEFMEIE
jgi:hypothetical protein